MADSPTIDAVFHNAVIVTMDDAFRVLQDGAVAVAGDRIAAVGPSADVLAAFPCAVQTLDLGGRIVLPGLVNTHVHTSQQLARGIADDVDLMTWLHGRIWPYESHMTEEDSYASTLLCGIELIRSGVTCFAEAGGQFVSEMARAVELLGFRACLTKSTMDCGDGLPPNWSCCSTDDCIQSQKELYEKHHNTADGRIRIWFGLRQIMNATDRLLLETRDIAQKLNTGIHMADLVVVNPFTWSMVPLHDSIANIVYCMRTENIESVMCNGRWIMKDHKIMNLNEVLLNGSPGNHIFHQRGLRQGDPLSPMLFVLVMDVLSSLFRAAENRGLLQSLGGADVRSRVSIYADDVVLFIKPIEADLNCAKMILNCFGSASGLVTNMLKSSAIPIRCDDQLVHAGYSVLQCSPTSFPCRYLGLPISDKKLRKCDLKLWIEKIADRLPNWKARLLNLAGWTALVKFVLSANPTYLLIAINVPQWVIKSIDKIQREFLWRGRKEVNGGSCLVPWEVVTRPLKFGGLGIPNFKFKSWALQAKWLWMEKTDLSRPWHGLSLLVQRHVRQFFDLSVFTILGNGATTLFWSDRWIHGNTIQDIAPEVVGMVGRRAYSSRTVAQALDN
ncbi:uncharacterized protein [Zea mays]|uniref:uncharacterized protein isoform X4 n=1 Tax=Zea mays TaxID=4577 RepID=UPI0009A9E53A|nr:uncharacterized protein LOC100283572 isoform X4 [Zea mays]|eukprot:XP_020405340.1 uncharacterized protein LOC100283572 isoform X4 [Zea mays]